MSGHDRAKLHCKVQLELSNPFSWALTLATGLSALREELGLDPGRIIIVSCLHFTTYAASHFSNIPTLKRAQICSLLLPWGLMQGMGVPRTFSQGVEAVLQPAPAIV